MGERELVQFIYDYSNIAAAEFKAKYPELIARREVINDTEGNTRSAMMYLVCEIASEIVEARSPAEVRHG